MEQKQHIIEQLWRYADNSCTNAEMNYIEKQLQDEEIWQAHWAEIQEVNKALRNMQAAQPSMRFRSNIMEKLAINYQQRSLEMGLLTRPLKYTLITVFGISTLFSLFLSSTTVSFDQYLDWEFQLPAMNGLIDSLGNFDITGMFPIIVSALCLVLVLDRFASVYLSRITRSPVND